MPAATKYFQSSKLLFLVFAFLLLAACSRDNPLSIPDEYIPTEEPYCLSGSPYVIEFLDSVKVTNTNNDFAALDYTLDEPIEAEFMPIKLHQTINNDINNHIQNTITVSSPFLLTKTIITPLSVWDALSDSGGGESSSLRVATEKEVLSDLSILSDSIIDKDTEVGGTTEDALSELQILNDYLPEIDSLSIKVSFKDESDTLVTESIDDETLFVLPELFVGNNEITITVDANVKVPRTSIDCLNPISQSEIFDDEFEEEDRFKNVNISQEFPLIIERKSLSDFVQVELTDSTNLSENDNFGRVVAINDNFMVLGVPSEGAGRVYVYSKSGLNSWSPHSELQPLISDEGDKFGFAVSLDGDKLAVSAPGEDSIAAGINLSSDTETDNLKLNNTALSSGAVYIYEFDQDTNVWDETFYIKPEQNVVSDGDFNKGFGNALILKDNKLIIAAPLEDSIDGDPSNSSVPNSGVVYPYQYSLSTLNWSSRSPIKAFNPGVSDQFGSSVALYDDSLFIGAPFEDHDARVISNFNEPNDNGLDDFLDNNSRTDAGSVYIYSYSLGEVKAYIKSSNSDAFDFFGSSLAVYNDTLLVGSLGEDSSGKGINRDSNKNDLNDSGAVYLYKFDENSEIWSENTYIKANDSQANSAFGKFIAIDDTNIFISAPLHDTDSLINAGKVYFYSLSDAELKQELSFQKSGTEQEMRFGSNLALKNQNLAIGASGFIKQDLGFDELFSGKVYAFE